MRRTVTAMLTTALISVLAWTAMAETTLEKVSRTGTLAVGTRTGSPPFGFINRQNEWVGFSIDLARLVHRQVEKKLGKAIRFELKETVPQTRIPLLTSGAVDLIAGTMTDTRARRESVDFSLTFFVTGAQFLVKKGSPVRGIQQIAGRRIGAQLPDQPAAFTALAQGKIDAYTNDGIQLAGLKAKAPNPADYEIMGEFYSYEPYGMAMRKNDSDFRHVVNVTLMEAIEGGEYFRLYEKWFGPRGEVPYPLSEQARSFLLMQVVPK
ncbi:MAG: transporter substrate-binding domain-containing protein [Deltaproteobacteria bacterium]|nr:transporter substrate-binding domain-containing protein [Deltaproteobacteria bacterium]